MNTSLDQTIDFKHYWRVVKRWRGIILLCAVVCVCATLVGLEFVPEEYESKVTMLIADRQPLSSGLEAVMGGMRQPQKSYGIDEERMARMVGRIRSRPFLERVIRMVEMDKDPRIREVAQAKLRNKPGVSVDEMTIRILVEGLQSRIRFGSSGKGVYQVTVADYAPENAQTLARWISELFVDTSVQSSLDYLRATHDFGSEQRKIYQEQLHRSETALAGYQENTIERRLSRTIVNDENVALARAMYQQISDQTLAVRVGANPLLDEAGGSGIGENRAQLLAAPVFKRQVEGLVAALEDELMKRLASTGSEGWPPQGEFGVRRRELFRQVEARIAEDLAAATPEARTAAAAAAFVQIDLESNAGAAQFLRLAMDDFQHQVQSEPGKQIESGRLEAEVETNRKLLQSFDAQLVASDVSQAMEMTKLGLQIEILDPAQTPLAPVRPDRTKILLSALFLGPLLGLALSFLGETMDSTLRSRDEFARVFPEPILGATPLLSKVPTRRGRVRRYWIPATASALIVLTVVFFISRDSLVDKLDKRVRVLKMVNPN